MLRNNPQQWRPWDPVTRQDLFVAIFDEFIFSQETAIIGKEGYVPPNIESRVKSAFAENSCFLGFCRSSSGWILIWCSLRLIWAQPGSRRDPPPYIYSHKFAQLSPRSNTASLFICFKKNDEMHKLHKLDAYKSSHFDHFPSANSSINSHPSNHPKSLSGRNLQNPKKQQLGFDFQLLQ